MTIQINYSSCNDGQWGDATDEQAITLAENCTSLAIAYSAKLWPEANIDGYRRDQPVFRAVAVYNRDGMDCEDVKAQIDDYIAHHWINEALWFDGFNAHEYLEANPQ